MQTIWKTFGPLNESHNGYLEVYLNLGFIGVFLLIAFIISSYRRICNSLSTMPILATLRLAFWTIMLFYNMTEAAFKAHLMWETFLLATLVVPIASESLAHQGAQPALAGAKQFPKSPYKPPDVGHGSRTRFKTS